jgi:aminobenzoyl-glutamate utilization protein B
MKIFSFFISILTFSVCLTSQSSKQVILNLDSNQKKYSKIAMQIWNHAELGYLEEKSSALLQNELTNEGFQVENNVAGIPTAFTASWGSGKPVIGILAEFDALPGVSQKAVPYRDKREDNNSGHACGHHLFGTASIAAGVSIKEWLDENKIKGTIRVLGTPAEEGGAGKVYMVRAGLFEDIDVVLHWHPSDGNSANAASSLANKSAKFRFYGRASHASSSPEKGRSALDAVESMNFMANLLREHIHTDSRLHYVITRGGEAPNVVPEFAEVFYYCRHPDMRIVKENFERLLKCAEAAAMGTGTKMEYEVIHGIYNVLPNETLGKVMHKNLSSLGGIKYDKSEIEFANKLKSSFLTATDITTAELIQPFKLQLKGTGGSTDVGDVSWMVPTMGLRTATWVPGTSAHTWQAVAAGGMSIGIKGMMKAAKTLTLTGIELYQKPEIIERAKIEWNSRRGGSDFKYEPLLGNRKPPLDYRK